MGVMFVLMVMWCVYVLVGWIFVVIMWIVMVGIVYYVFLVVDYNLMGINVVINEI